MTTRLLPPILLAALATGVIFIAMDYGKTASQLPLLIAATTLVLAILDVVSRLDGTPGRVLRALLGAGFEDRELDFEPRIPKEIIQVLWIVAVVTGITLVGILVAVPLFVFAYTWAHGRWSVYSSVLAGALVLAIVSIIFEVLLDYTLFRGVLFGADTYV